LRTVIRDKNRIWPVTPEKNKDQPGAKVQTIYHQYPPIIAALSGRPIYQTPFWQQRSEKIHWITVTCRVKLAVANGITIFPSTEARMFEAFVIALTGYGVLIGSAQTAHFLRKLRSRK
jgi:hypothetical protein